MPDLCDARGQPREHLQCFGGNNDLGLYSGGREEEVGHDAPATLGRDSETDSCEPAGCLLLDDRNGSVAATGEQPHQRLSLRVARNCNCQINIASKPRFGAR